MRMDIQRNEKARRIVQRDYGKDGSGRGASERAALA